MNNKLGDRPAAPIVAGPDLQVIAGGLTIRQHAAIAAMQTILGWDTNPSRRDGESYQQATARLAVQYADALIAELEPRHD